MRSTPIPGSFYTYIYLTYHIKVTFIIDLKTIDGV